MVVGYIVTMVALNLLGAGFALADDKKRLEVFIGVGMAAFGIATLLVHLGVL